jgi:hypothetical protein
MSWPKDYPIIVTAKRFHGYLVALGVEAACPEFQSPQRMLATFEYYGEQQTWEVPSCALFEKLWQHLYGNALHHFEHGDYGYDRVLIWQRRDGEWQVKAPSASGVKKARKLAAGNRNGVQRL